MRRDESTKLCRTELDKNGLQDWHVRLSDLQKKGLIAVCMYDSKTIVINYHAVDLHPDAEILNTIRHEIAHALTKGHGHDDVWAKKAREIGCDYVSQFCSLGLPHNIIEAIRSNNVIEAIVSEEVIPEQVKRSVEYRVTRLQDKCAECGKVAKETKSIELGKQGKKLIFLECGHVVVKEIPKESSFEDIVFDDDPNCKHVWPDKIHNGQKIKGTICSKCGAKRPYDFQIAGMKLLEKHNGRFGVFDEQGLGKTIQTLGYLKFHPESSPFLYICKAGLKYQASREIVRILGPTYIPIIIHTGKDHILAGFKAYIVSYDLLRRLPQSTIDRLKSFVKTVIIDEVQHIKNPDSTRTQEVRKICRDVEHIIPLSGTPWKNRGSEFYVCLNLINPTKFNSLERFKTNWVDYYYQGSKTKEGGIRADKLVEFKSYVSDCCVRRERSEVMKELPLINRTKLYCEMPKEAAKQYGEAVNEFMNIWNQLVIGGEEDSFAGNSTMMGALNTMRQITGIAKIPVTLDHVTEFIEGHEAADKIVVFVHHIAVGQTILSNLKEWVKEEGLDINVLALKGGASPEERDEIVQDFNNNPKTRVLIASTLASGEGLNLQTCSYCIMHERQWNPANEEQAESRFVRIGQKSETVTAVYVEATGTVDEDLDILVNVKRIQFHNAMNQTNMIAWNQTSIMKQLCEATAKRWSQNRKTA